MNLRAVGAALFGVAAVLAPASPASASNARVLFTITDHRIDEASGIAVGRASPGVLYVQNDSGDSSRFFALNRRTGATAATVEVPHARNHDWEDLAVAPDRAGRPSVWLADIGDNDAGRDEIQVYRVDEPRIVATARNERIVSARPDLWRLRYPTGPANAESFAVTPAGVGYLVTKSLLGASVVYRLPPRPDDKRVQTLARVGTIAFRFTGTPGGPNPIGQLTATGAAFSADGALFVVRTYTDAYFWRVAGGELAAALNASPIRVALPEQPQGEGVTIDGPNLLIDSEHVGSAVYSVPLPALLQRNGPAPGTTTSPTAATQPAVRDSNDVGPSAAVVFIIAVSVLVGVSTAIRTVRRRRSANQYP